MHFDLNYIVNLLRTRSFKAIVFCKNLGKITKDKTLNVSSSYTYFVTNIDELWSNLANELIEQLFVIALKYMVASIFGRSSITIHLSGGLLITGPIRDTLNHHLSSFSNDLAFLLLAETDRKLLSFFERVLNFASYINIKQNGINKRFMINAGYLRGVLAPPNGCDFVSSLDGVVLDCVCACCILLILC